MSTTFTKERLILFAKVLVVAFVCHAIWYNLAYSMSVAESFEVNDPIHPKKILIATQKSNYKDSLTNQIIREIKDTEVYIKVIDVGSIDKEKLEKFSAILLICSIEYGRPPSKIKSFLSVPENLDKTYVYNTSGGADFVISDVDGISGASVLSNTQVNVRLISDWILKKTNL